jgi:hypothetical protein
MVQRDNPVYYPGKLLLQQTVVKLHCVSEWLLFNAKSAIFQLYHGDNRFIFNEKMKMRFALY